MRIKYKDTFSHSTWNVVIGNDKGHAYFLRAKTIELDCILPTKEECQSYLQGMRADALTDGGHSLIYLEIKLLFDRKATSDVVYQERLSCHIILDKAQQEYMVCKYGDTVIYHEIAGNVECGSRQDVADLEALIEAEYVPHYDFS